ncbi:MAG TPA: amidophosphoribosyltransferase [bacterium]|nr:amidophosphoribosyltransferase [bacterium]HPG45504.1 amidophosphoribosyltransferase [bacterium]HPM96720.1 amidophosphoribosyltransferase [bacterium]
MGGLFGVAAKQECVLDLFYGTDYHSHLGTRRGGMAVLNGDGFTRSIHNIENSPFRTKFEDDLAKFHGSTGIGCISNAASQPLIIGSHLGTFAIATTGRLINKAELVDRLFRQRTTHFSEMSGGKINSTELVATLINRQESFVQGIHSAQQAIEGACSMLLLTGQGIIASRDRLGRTPLIIGKKADSHCVGVETCAFPNLGYEPVYELGPGEIVRLTADGFEQLQPPGKQLQICAFLWIYYGYPASTYEGRNVEQVRNRCGACLAKRDTVKPDLVAGIPDSGISHALGYANAANLPYCRPFVKYTPTWPRSFMPQDQTIRNLVARMKLIPIRELIDQKNLLFCDDSIVRGTQLRETIQRLFSYGAAAVHMRPACPPLVFSCPFLNLSRNRSELDLAARRAIEELQGPGCTDFTAYTDHTTADYAAMVDRIRQHLGLTTLRYQHLTDMIKAIGLPQEQICTFCWTGRGR